MKRVIITGSLGYVGSVLAPYLTERGFEVRGFDTGFFKDELLYPVAPYETLLKDARDLTKEDLRGYDAVVHLAAISNDPVGSVSEETIYGPTREYAARIAGFCKELGMGFVFASSCSVYGAGTGDLTDEDGPVAPITPYSRNKLAIEGDLKALAGDSFSPVALRFATAYGLSPRMRFDLVINMLAGMAVAEKSIVLNSDGSAWRPFIHVEDMACAIENALTSAPRKGELVVLNAGQTDENFQIKEIAHMVSEATPGTEVSFLKQAALGAETAELVRDRKIADGKDARTYRVSFERIRQVLPGFSPAHTVRESIPAMVSRLGELGFSADDFKRTGFYRLQKMEELVSDGALDESFRWRHS